MPAEQPASERDLWRIWEERGLPVSLSTRDGRALRVLFPGVANAEPGPDFKGALLVLDSRPSVRGDVEMHLKATAWEGHGHHRDPRYNAVILHVVLFDDGGPAWTEAGTAVPVLALGPILRLLDDTPRDPAAGPCYSPDTPRAPLPDLSRLLRDAGRARFEDRVAAWEGELARGSVEDAVLLALLRCAGLGRNREACEALARALDGATLEAAMRGRGAQAETVAAAVLLGMAGLLDAGAGNAALHETWHSYRQYWHGRPLETRQWQRFRLRPANLPENRLRQIAAIAARHGLADFLEGLRQIFLADTPPTTAALLCFLTSERAAPGRAWGLEALANALLPLVAARARALGTEHVAQRIAACYAALPGGGANSRLARMTRIAGLAAVPRLAIEQQGLLQLWGQYCARQRCARCPLAAPR